MCMYIGTASICLGTALALRQYDLKLKNHSSKLKIRHGYRFKYIHSFARSLKSRMSQICQYLRKQCHRVKVMLEGLFSQVATRFFVSSHNIQISLALELNRRNGSCMPIMALCFIF